MQASLLVLAENSRVAARLPWFERAYAAYEKIGQPKFLARTLNNWGHQLWLIGQWQEAQGRLERALALFEEGVACLREAASTLVEAEARVQKLTELADGAFDVAPLDDE